LPVINAGDGTHEHPTQALLDALTIRDRLGTVEKLNVTILGDILHSRVARSNIHLLSKFGCRITLCGPPMWVPGELEFLGAPGSSVRCVARIEEALTDADVVITLRVQQERLHEPALSVDEYILQYQLTPLRLQLARPDALVLHPGPVIRGVEIDSAVADGRQSCVLEQVTNGIAVRMALLFLMTGTAPEMPSSKESANATD
jgi:aspartate carbamoyltransferase catalytic subunit